MVRTLTRRQRRSGANEAADNEVSERTHLRIQLTTKLLGHSMPQSAFLNDLAGKQMHARATSAFEIKALITWYGRRLNVN